MELSKEEVRLEEKRLDDTIKLIREKISVLGQEFGGWWSRLDLLGSAWVREAEHRFNPFKSIYTLF